MSWKWPLEVCNYICHFGLFNVIINSKCLIFPGKKDSVMLPSLILKRLFDKLVNKRKSHHIHLDRFPLFFIFYLLLICLRPF